MSVIAMKVASVEDHPNAESLKMYWFEAPGYENKFIIANLENVYSVGDIAYVAMEGAVLKDGTKIRPTKIRGIMSYGMALGHADNNSAAPGDDFSDTYCVATSEQKVSVIKWPDIESLFNVRRDLKKQDLYPTVSYRAKIKLDGSNAAIQITSDGKIAAQSRTSIITPQDDNMGFARWAYENMDYFEELKSRVIGKHTVVFGEWCFYHDTPVLLANGTSRKIGEIVNNKEKLDVLTFNIESNKLEIKKIIGWNKVEWSGEEDNNKWVTINVRRRHRGGKSTKLIVTKSHYIFCKKESKIVEQPAGELQAGDIVYVLGKKIGYYQLQFIMGSLLGDGFSESYGIFTCSHSEDNQPYYNKFISNLLTGLITCTDATSGYGSRMKVFTSQSLPEVKNLQDILQINGVKHPTKKYLNKMHAPAFAAWYMDDGFLEAGKNNRQYLCALSTLGYSKEVNEEIIEWFIEHGFDCYICKVNKNNNVQYYIRFSPDGSEAFARMIAPYIISEFEYKLPGHLREGAKINWEHQNPMESIIETEIISVEEGNPYAQPYKRHKYDITVEDNHNFFANKVLVHNCGKGIQKRTAISEIDRKVFVVFAIQSGFSMIVEPNYIQAMLPSHDDVFVLPWYGNELTLDYSDAENLQIASDKINKMVLDVEQCDPWVKHIFGIEGIGEGVVMYPLYEYGETISTRDKYTEYVFKAKGDKHKVVKTKKAAQIDPEVAANVDEFVSLFTTDARMEQGVTVACNGELDMKRMGDFLKWFVTDVKKESEAELEASSLKWEQVNKAIMTAARKWYQEKAQSI